MNAEGDTEVAAVVRLAVVCCLVCVVMFFGIILYLGTVNNSCCKLWIIKSSRALASPRHFD
jgi:hypothetical protein